ncbi:MAG: PA14 domain-containing protein [Pikeienuella sp.]
MRGIGLSAVCFLTVVAAAHAEMLQLQPADPQPDPATLAQGLAVSYAYPPDVKDLRDAEYWLGEGAKAGSPLSGLRYIDTLEGEEALTSGQATRVAAEITGYVHFARAGAHMIEFHSNDGVRAVLGGREVAFNDGRHPCETGGYQEVNAPAPGWYELKVTWFQRLGSACLLMKWDGGEGGMGWAKNEVFAYRK